MLPLAIIAKCLSWKPTRELVHLRLVNKSWCHLIPQIARHINCQLLAFSWLRRPHEEEEFDFGHEPKLMDEAGKEYLSWLLDTFGSNLVSLSFGTWCLYLDDAVIELIVAKATHLRRLSAECCTLTCSGGLQRLRQLTGLRLQAIALTGGEANQDQAPIIRLPKTRGVTWDFSGGDVSHDQQVLMANDYLYRLGCIVAIEFAWDPLGVNWPHFRTLPVLMPALTQLTVEGTKISPSAFDTAWRLSRLAISDASRIWKEIAPVLGNKGRLSYSLERLRLSFVPSDEPSPRFLFGYNCLERLSIITWNGSVHKDILAGIELLPALKVLEFTDVYVDLEQPFDDAYKPFPQRVTLSSRKITHLKVSMNDMAYTREDMPDGGFKRVPLLKAEICSTLVSVSLALAISEQEATQLTDFLAMCTNLETLKLFQCRHEDLSLSFLKALGKLKVLHLHTEPKISPQEFANLPLDCPLEELMLCSHVYDRDVVEMVVQRRYALKRFLVQCCPIHHCEDMGDYCLEGDIFTGIPLISSLASLEDVRLPSDVNSNRYIGDLFQLPRLRFLWCTTSTADLDRILQERAAANHSNSLEFLFMVEWECKLCRPRGCQDLPELAWHRAYDGRCLATMRSLGLRANVRFISEKDAAVYAKLWTGRRL